MNGNHPMNEGPGGPPEGGWESQITARLLGELSEAESRVLDQALARDPELVLLEERLRRMLPLVREAVLNPGDAADREASSAAAAAAAARLPRMSGDRREVLLRRLRGEGAEDGAGIGGSADFGGGSGRTSPTVIPVAFADDGPVGSRWRGAGWLALAAAAVGLLLTAALLPEIQTVRMARVGSVKGADKHAPIRPFSVADAETARRSTLARSDMPALEVSGKAEEKVVTFADTAVDSLSVVTPSVPPMPGPTPTAAPTPTARTAAGRDFGAYRVGARPGSAPEPVPPAATSFATSAAAPAAAPAANAPATASERTEVWSRSTALMNSRQPAPESVGRVLAETAAPAVPMGVELMRRGAPVSGPSPDAGSAGERRQNYFFEMAGEPAVAPPALALRGVRSGGVGEAERSPVSREARVSREEAAEGMTPRMMSRYGLAGGAAAPSRSAGADAAEARAKMLATGVPPMAGKPGDAGANRFAMEPEGRLRDLNSVAAVAGVGVVTDWDVAAGTGGAGGGGGGGGFGGGGPGSSATGPAAGAASGLASAAGARGRGLARGEAESVESALKDAVVERLGEAATDRSRMFGSERAQTLAKERAGVVAGGYTNGVKLGDEPVLGQEFLGFAGAEDVKLVAQGVGGEDESKRKANNGVGEGVAALEVQGEVAAVENALSTFSLNVTDVSFRLAGASLEQGQVPGPGTVRVEEFVNAFSYRDPEPAPGMPLGFVWERGRYPFAQQRDVLRLGVRTRAQGREEGRPLNLVLAVDNSGSMERADRVATVREALRVLGGQLKPADTLSVVTFARTPRLWMDGLTGDRVGDLAAQFGSIPPEGGTHLESALRLGYETALRHYRADGVNRVVLLTDGAANLGEVRAEALRELVAENRSRGVALDCFGVGFDGYHDELLEALSRNGDGRYGFVNTPEEAATGFANQLAGALQVAAEDVKVQVEFNPERVNQWRQIGYARHQLTADQFRDNTVDAAEIGAAESGNALYVVEVRPGGRGPIATVRARYREPSTREYQEHAWEVPYDGPAVALERASPALRLATTAAAFGEMLSGSPYATEVTGDRLLALLGNVPEVFRPDPRPQQLGQMIQQAQLVLGR